MSLSQLIDQKIVETINSEIPKEDFNAFQELISLGELVDRLTIVNIKLYNLKNEVMQNVDDESFLAKSALFDVALVKERARLKACIDLKINAMIANPSFNKEVKSYGDKFND
jgi:hypothetical protein